MTPEHKWDRNREHLSTHFKLAARHGNGMTGELSRANELPNGFLDRFRWQWLLQAKSLKGG